MSPLLCLLYWPPLPCPALPCLRAAAVCPGVPAAAAAAAADPPPYSPWHSPSQLLEQGSRFLHPMLVKKSGGKIVEILNKELSDDEIAKVHTLIYICIRNPAAASLSNPCCSSCSKSGGGAAVVASRPRYQARAGPQQRRVFADALVLPAVVRLLRYGARVAGTFKDPP